MVARSLVLTVLVACGPVKGTPPGGGDDAPTGDPAFQLATLTTSPNVPLDGRAAIELAITRMGGFDGEVTIAPVTPPNGLQIDPLVIAAGETTGELAVGAITPLAIGDTVTFTIEATATEQTAQQLEFEDIEVTGKPGTLDITWGAQGTGFGLIGIAGDDGRFDGMEILAGKVLATGFGTGGLGATTFATTRFTADGLIDTTWDSNPDPTIAVNLVRNSFTGGSGESSFATAIGHQFDGRPIVIGRTDNGVALVRLSTSGGDGGQEFGTLSGSKSILDLDPSAGSFESVNDGLVLADGKVVFVGDVAGRQVVGRTDSTGNLDPGFAGTGFIAETINDGATAKAVAVDAMNRIVVVGSTTTASQFDVTVSRYTAAGVLDNTFGDAGRKLVSLQGVGLFPIGIAVLSSGKVLVAMTSGDAGNTHYAVFQLLADGAPDLTFGTDGVADVTTAGTVIDMTVLPDGKIMMIGQNGTNATLVRFKANGKVDTLFGTDGIAEVPFGDGAQIGCIEVYDAHKIVIGGSNGGPTPGPGIKGLVARLWN